MMKREILTLSLAAAILWIGPVTAHSGGLPPFIRGHNVCAINVSRAVHIKPTYAARDFLRFQRVTNPRPGDVAVNKRPGGYHAQKVVGTSHGIPVCANPSSRRQRWIIQDCNATWRGHRKIYVRVK